MTARYHKLLCGYANYIRRAGYVNAAAIALRTNSKTIRDVIAYIATNNKLSVAELRSSLDETSLPDIKYRIRWLATLGRICALQAAQEQNPAKRDEDALFGLRLLQFANRELPNDRQHQQFHRLEIDLLAREGQFETARELLETNSYLREYYYGYLLTDLQNPSLTGASDTYIPWLEGFNRPFCENGLLPVRAVSDVPFTFDRLSTRPASPRTGGD